jgi:aspartate aminotransferase-like enzyme
MDEQNIRLMIPGPVEIHPKVYQAMNRLLYGHRTNEFREILKESIEMLKEICRTQNDMFIFSGSGTSAMDSAIANLVSKGDEVLNIMGGKFAERWIEITQTYGGKSIPVDVEWGNAINLDDMKAVLDANPNIKFITFTHNETSTGVLQPGEEIAKIAQEYDKILIVDAITSVGGDYCETDKWGFDVLVTGSQKCLGLPPGLGMIAVNQKAWDVIESRSYIPSYYLNLKKHRVGYKKYDTPYTPALPLFYAAHKGFQMILEEGYDNRVKRHRLCGRAMREGMKAIGFELFADPQYASNTVTAVKYMDGLDDAEFKKTMLKHKVLIAGGQGKVKGKIFRAAHMNLCTDREVLLMLEMTELVLKELGFDIELGSGVSAAEKVFL